MFPITQIKNIFKKRQTIITEIDPELARNNEKYAQALNWASYLNGKLQRAEQTIKDLTKKEDNSQIAQYLNDQKKDLIEQERGTDSSLLKLLKYTKKKKKKNIHVTSYNHRKDFGILRDFGFSKNGLISIYVHGVDTPIISGRTTYDTFRNIAGLEIDAQKGILAVNLDEKGNYVENLEVIETPNVLIDFNKKIHIMGNDQKPFIERIIEKNRIIDDQMSELRNNEKLISELTQEINGEKMNVDVLRNENRSYKVSLSDTMNNFKEVQKNYHRLSKELSILEEDNTLFEEFKERTDKVIQELHDRLSEKEEQAVVDRAMEKIKKITRWYENTRPKVEINDAVEEKTMPKPVKI